MPDQFHLCIAGGTQSADDSSFPGDRIVNRDHKDKGDDHDHNIEKDQHHGPVASHILSGELDGLIDIARQEILQIDFIRDILHKPVRELFFLLF